MPWLESKEVAIVLIVEADILEVHDRGIFAHDRIAGQR